MYRGLDTIAFTAIHVLFCTHVGLSSICFMYGGKYTNKCPVKIKFPGNKKIARTTVDSFYFSYLYLYLVHRYLMLLIKSCGGNSSVFKLRLSLRHSFKFQRPKTGITTEELKTLFENR